MFPPFSNPAGSVADWLGTDGGLDTLAWTYAVNIAFMVGMTNLILVIHLERKIAARIQDRRGPMLSLRSFRELGEDLAGEAPTWKFKDNYSGIGIIQNMVDGIKAITKELIVPAKADRFLFTMGPIIFISSSVFCNVTNFVLFFSSSFLLQYFCLYYSRFQIDLQLHQPQQV